MSERGYWNKRRYLLCSLIYPGFSLCLQGHWKQTASGDPSSSGLSSLFSIVSDGFRTWIYLKDWGHHYPATWEYPWVCSDSLAFRTREWGGGGAGFLSSPPSQTFTSCCRISLFKGQPAAEGSVLLMKEAALIFKGFHLTKRFCYQKSLKIIIKGMICAKVVFIFPLFIILYVLKQ